MATSSLSSWVIPIRRALDAAGCDSEALLVQAGLDLQLLQDPNARYPLDKTSALWRLAVKATADEAFGLKVASFVTPTTFHALGYSLGASATLKDMFERTVRFVRLFTDVANLDFVQQADEYYFYLRPPVIGPHAAFESTDAFISLFLRVCRSRVGKEFSPLRISVRRPKPNNTEEFERRWRAPIRFSAEENYMVLDRTIIDKRLPDGNDDLARHNDEVIVRQLARIDRDSIEMRVRAVLLEALPQGDISEENVADMLNLSCRNMQRKLAEKNTSYRHVLDTTRRDLALFHIRNQRISLSDITYQLGFSDSRSFGRAFKRWTGVSPSEFRDQVEPRAVEAESAALQK